MNAASSRGVTPTGSQRPASGSISSRSNIVSQTYEELDALTKLLQDKVNDLYERLSEEDRSIRQLSADMDTRVTAEALEKLRMELEQRGSVGNKVGDEPVYMPQLKHVAFNFQNQIKDVDKQIRDLQDLMPNLVSRDDLTELINAIQAGQIQRGSDVEATAAGRLSYRCLLCGKPTSTVTGMITEAEVARMIGEPPTSGVGKAGDDFVLVYGRDGAYRAASPPSRKKISLPRINPSAKQNQRPQTTLGIVTNSASQA